MKLAAMVTFVALTASMACGGKIDDGAAVGSTGQELRGDPSQLLVQVDRSGVPYELYVTTCNPMPNIHDYVQMEACENNGTHIEQVSVQIRDASGTLVGRLDQGDLVDDRPGGGCIHFQLPTAPAGGSLVVHANVKGLAGAGNATTVFDLTTAL
jgi:hypothetical protein